MGIFVGFLEITNAPNVICGRTDNGNLFEANTGLFIKVMIALRQLFKPRNATDFRPGLLSR